MSSKIRLEMATIDDHIRICKRGALLSYVNVIGIQGKEKEMSLEVRNKRIRK
jgi:hypothetical protein